MPKVSVIIPVYNVEEYLPQCLESVINQTYKDLQIICINDGSTDNSLKILEEFVQKDERIVIKTQENQGVGVARNNGLKISDGEYITFIDPDDWWELNMVEKVVTQIINDKSDIVHFGYCMYQNKKILLSKEKENRIESLLQANDNKKYTNYFVNFIWDKIYKTSFIKENKIEFPKNIHPTEDVLFALECFSHNPKISFIKDCLYIYRIDRDKSAMNNYKYLVPNQIKALKFLLKSPYYKNGNIEFKEKCLNLLIGGIADFFIDTIDTNFKSYNLSLIKKALVYINEKIPETLLEDCLSYRALNYLIKLDSKDFQKIKEKNINIRKYCLIMGMRYIIKNI